MNPPENELDRLYTSHAQALFQFLLALTRSDSETKDLLQEVFVRLARKWPGPGAIRDERAWLLTLAYRLYVDACRRRGAHQTAVHRLALEPSAIFEKEVSADAETFRRAVESAMNTLPAEQAAVVQLKLWSGLTFAEIAGVLSIPPNTAASRYRYGLDKLRDALRPLYGEIT